MWRVGRCFDLPGATQRDEALWGPAGSAGIGGNALILREGENVAAENEFVPSQH